MLHPDKGQATRRIGILRPCPPGCGQGSPAAGPERGHTTLWRTAPSGSLEEPEVTNFVCADPADRNIRNRSVCGNPAFVVTRKAACRQSVASALPAPERDNGGCPGAERVALWDCASRRRRAFTPAPVTPRMLLPGWRCIRSATGAGHPGPAPSTPARTARSAPTET